MAVRVVSLLLPMLLAGPMTALGQTPPPFSAFLMEESRELALARSAAPASVTGKAGYYVLRLDGRYEPVAPSQNGFHCLVERSFTVPTTTPQEFYEPRVVAPICFNAEASATVMQRDLFLAPLVAAGTPLLDIRRMENEAYASGRLRYPRKPAIAYMFSSAQWLGPKITHWHPHVMIWVADLEPLDLAPADVGTFGVESGFPVMDPRFGPRQRLIVIPAAKAIDPVFDGRWSGRGRVFRPGTTHDSFR